jgi:hypothetical protein
LEVAAHVHGNKLQNTVLSKHTDDDFAMGLSVFVDQWQTTSVSLDEAFAGIKQRTKGMNR